VQTRKRNDVRLRAALLTLGLVLLTGGVIYWLPSMDSRLLPPAAQEAAGATPRLPAGFDTNRHKRAQRVATRFQQAVHLLQQKNYPEALTAWQRVLAVAPELPEAWVNLGYTRLGLKQYREAEKAFRHAIRRRAGQANAYYGLALSLAGQKKYAMAADNMQVYLERAPKGEPYGKKARKLRDLWRSRREETGSAPNSGN